MNENALHSLKTIPITLPDDLLEGSAQTERYIALLEDALPKLRVLLTEFRKEGI